MATQFALFVLGLVVLTGGAELFIRGSVGVARRFGVSPFLIGLTLVGFGTSAPELVVNLSAAFNNAPGLATGNVVGSNIANVGLILGAAALVRPLAGRMQLLKAEIPVMLGSSLLVWGLAADGTLGRPAGAVLLAAFVGFMVYMFRAARAEPKAVKEEIAGAVPAAPPLWLTGATLLVGLVGLVGGAQLMVDAAVTIATAYGVSEVVIGLTVVAVGTSLPELAASAVAAWKGESDIALGNVIGSNVFNATLVLGLTAAVLPLPVPDRLVMNEIPVMNLFALLLLAALANGLKVHRWEGGLLLAAYAGFVAWQVAGAKT